MSANKELKLNNCLAVLCARIAVCASVLVSVCSGGLAQVTGRIVTYPKFESRFVKAHRIDVWLPTDYSASKKYAVVYCNDGQNLFDTTTNIWHQEWRMDETAQRLMQEGKTDPFIVVGIWNAGTLRHAEYFPEKAVRDMPLNFQDSLQSLMRTVHPKADLDTLIADAYLKFLVTELKPFIDATYSTKKDRKNTFILGSSSGALSAMYAVCEYPRVFGGAACLSTHFTGIFRQQNNPFPNGVLAYFSRNHPSRKHKLYFDTGDVGLDSLYTPHFAQLQTICLNSFKKSDRISMKTFKGATHNENAWADRLEEPLIFLLGKPKK